MASSWPAPSGSEGRTGLRDSDRGPALVSPGEALLVPRPAGGSLDATIGSLESRLASDPRGLEGFGRTGVRVRPAGPDHLGPLHVSARRKQPSPLTRAPAQGQRRCLPRYSGRWRRRDTTSPPRSVGDAAPSGPLPFNADVYGLLGDAQLELGRYRAAFASFQRMVDTRPDLVSYGRVSYALELRGNVPGRDRRDARGLRRGSESGGHRLGGRPHRQAPLPAGRIRQAREVVPARAGRRTPTSMEAQLGLALVAWASGDLEEAIAGHARLATRSPAPDHLAGSRSSTPRRGDHEAAAAQVELVRAAAQVSTARTESTPISR